MYEIKHKSDTTIKQSIVFLEGQLSCVRDTYQKIVTYYDENGHLQAISGANTLDTSLQGCISFLSFTPAHQSTVAVIEGILMRVREIQSQKNNSVNV